MSGYGSASAQIQHQKQRIRVLRSLRQALANSEVFDDEDVGFIDDAIEQEEVLDEELLALQENLPLRQQLLGDFDKQYGLSTRFPDLMARFVEKDVDLFTMLEEKLGSGKRHR
jgi:hypothetical protein